MLTEAVASVNVFGLVNGGTGGLIWVYLGTFAGFFCAILSMAEMASMQVNPRLAFTLYILTIFSGPQQPAANTTG
jgi:hypothetical protein